MEDQVQGSRVSEPCGILYPTLRSPWTCENVRKLSPRAFQRQTPSKCEKAVRGCQNAHQANNPNLLTAGSLDSASARAGTAPAGPDHALLNLRFSGLAFKHPEKYSYIGSLTNPYEENQKFPKIQPSSSR